MYKIRKGLYGSSDLKEDEEAYFHKERDFKKEAEEILVKNGQNKEELAEQFIREAINVNSQIYDTADQDDINGFLIDLVARKRISSFAVWESDFLKKLGVKKHLRDKGLKTVTAKSKNRIAKGGIGITEADYAIADTGTLVLLTDKNKPRSVSLLPPIHIAVLRKENIVRNINELFVILKHKLDTDKGITSCMTFITGPSRTADIELNLTLGVHGPKELYVVLTA
ncbi:MAG: lactate utilization protein [Deltaproteobacteria bacterium]